MKKTIADPHNPDRRIFCEAVAQGQFVRQSDSTQYPIPGTLNGTLAVAQIIVSFALLGGGLTRKNFLDDRTVCRCIRLCHATWFRSGP